MKMAPTTLNIMCWNCRGVMTGAPYLVKCLNEHDIDVCGISEHHLRTFNTNFLNTLDPNYTAFTKCATERDPSLYRIINKGGVALLIKKVLIHCTNVMELDSDRVIGIEVVLNDSTVIYIFCAYLPASNLSNDLFLECSNLLEELYIAYSPKGTVIIIGDLNVKIEGPKIRFVKDIRSDMFHKFVSNHNLVSVNVQRFCKGPCHTYESFIGGPSSAIDHILIPDYLLPYVRNAFVKDDSELSVSDHKPVICSILVNTSIDKQFIPLIKPSWEKARRYNLLNDYTFAVSHMLWPVKILSKDATYDTILEFYNTITRFNSGS